MRAFITRRAGAGTEQDPFRPDINDALYPGLAWSCWDVEHPADDSLVGFVVVWTGNSVPASAIADLGDPNDPATWENVAVPDAQADAIAAEFGVPVGQVRTKTARQIIDFINRKDPVLAAAFAGSRANLKGRPDHVDQDPPEWSGG